MWQLDERTRIYAPTDFEPVGGERDWRILRMQPCRYVDCFVREHWEWLPERYATEAAALTDARKFLSEEPWPRTEGE